MRKHRTKADEMFQRQTDEYKKVKIQCKNCGYKSVIPVWVDRQICSWCGNYVYRNKKLEFKEMLKKRGVEINVKHKNGS